MNQPKPLKRAVIKEELVVLTGDFMEALVLNQFIYWTSRVRDYDKMLREEIEAARLGGIVGEFPLRHGWIYKKAEELGEELMIGKSDRTIRRVLAHLLQRGWLCERNNPDHGWDKTKQYRVNLALVQRDLAALGYALDGYTQLVSESANESDRSNEQGANGTCHDVLAAGQPAASNGQNARGCGQNAAASGQNAGAIPEITPETTPEITLDNKHREIAPATPGPAECVSDSTLTAYSQEFESFWAAYPKQTNKWGAFRMWQKALKRKQPQTISADELVAAAGNYSMAVQGTAPRYLMNPVTFLGPDCHYLDHAMAAYPGSQLHRPATTDGDAELRRYVAAKTADELIAALNSTPDDLLGIMHWYIRSELLIRGLDVDRVDGVFELV